MSEPISTCGNDGHTTPPIWGLARADGGLWDDALFTLGNEITDDRKVLVCFDKTDAINGFMWSDEGAQQGPLIVVQYTTRPPRPWGWYAYPDTLLHLDIDALAYGHQSYRDWLTDHPEAVAK